MGVAGRDSVGRLWPFGVGGAVTEAGFSREAEDEAGGAGVLEAGALCRAGDLSEEVGWVVSRLVKKLWKSPSVFSIRIENMSQYIPENLLEQPFLVADIADMRSFCTGDVCYMANVRTGSSLSISGWACCQCSVIIIMSCHLLCVKEFTESVVKPTR